MIKEIQAKSILIKQKRIDSWFMAAYGMNIYRGCSHNCAYCDGRDNKYGVAGDFGNTISAKMNSPQLVKKALDPKYKRTPFKNGYLLLGGGVCDAYQPIEEKLQLTRQVLEVIVHYNRPVHFLTKNALIERDLDIIKDIHEQSGAIVSMSFSTVNDKISQQLEPGCSLPSTRLKTLEKFKQAGIPIGMFLMPVIPFLTDTPNMIDATMQAAKRSGVEFVIFGTMTLKPGQQKEYFLQIMKKYYPNLIEFYEQLYGEEKWGNPKEDYINQISLNFSQSAKKYHLPRRIPGYLYQHLLSENECVSMMLEHLDYCLKLDGRPSPYSKAAYQILKLNQPLREVNNLQSIKGIGPTTESIIRDILNHGKSSYLDSVI